MQNYNLPLSWVLLPPSKYYPPENVSLPGKFVWHALSYIPDNSSWLKEFEKTTGKILIRGVGRAAAIKLKENGYKTHLTGEEAVIDLSNKLHWKKSVKELYRRGRKTGHVIEIPYSAKAASDLNRFKKYCRHGGKPELRYLFNNAFLPSTRLFIVCNEEDKWLAAVVLSKNNVEKYQCEMLLKRKGKYRGVMEYLIMEIAGMLKAEGVREFSLGEVPFVKMDFENKVVNILFSVMRPIISLSYSYKGLFFFKNKFSPEWKPIYLCANSNIKLIDLFILSLRTNFLNLIVYNLKEQSRALLKIHRKSGNKK